MHHTQLVAFDNTARAVRDPSQFARSLLIPPRRREHGDGGKDEKTHESAEPSFAREHGSKATAIGR